MAKQVGLLKLQGSVGGLSFYKKGDEYNVRVKGGPSREQVLKDPKFKRTRENSSEFARAVRVAKSFRDALRAALAKGADKKFSLRLNARMLHLLKADAESRRGERNVCVPHLTQLQGMECNVNTQLSETFFLTERPAYDRAQSKAQLILPPIRPRDSFRKQPSATHVQLELTALVFHPYGDSPNEAKSDSSAYLDLYSSQPIASIGLEVELQADKGAAVFLLLGINYYQMVNEAYYPLTDLHSKVLTIIEVDLSPLSP